ncbi:CRISPR-associated endonuclease Cas1 [Fuchsiella alkaliacetigena]|uniref:CRISPR-associated endonuclease Cas1 n=1 Tax=Fuchsiella alkaliacetigena TaxID=957042 RepID=UPI00200B1878|nr:CRISPR-associated endonuclease Cas1 [Fuchsiella alkaliacetigena]MCK8825708.1 CRISPR-associated endonuclease Cas1 [Fuchsiella alkaliacetigena]
MGDKSLVVSDYGVFIGKKSERVVLKKKKEVLKEIPFFKLKEILITTPAVSLSSALVNECAKAGIQIDFVAYNGQHLAKLVPSAMSGTVKTRRQQLLAYQDERGIRLSIAFAKGKIENQLVLLKYLAKYRKKQDRELYKLIYKQLDKIKKIKKELAEIEGQQIDEVREYILSIEGRAAKQYWQVVKKVIPKEIDFPGRKGRGANDLVNSLLNYGYGILYSRVSSAILRAGLDQFAGFLHADRPGKPSLVLDLIEEFRQTVVDKTVIGLLNQGMNFELEKGQLADDCRHKFADKVLGRLKSKERYEGKKYRLEVILQRQARSIAAYLRGKREYQPFVSGW